MLRTLPEGFQDSMLVLKEPGIHLEDKLDSGKELARAYFRRNKKKV